jgi:hypothetical protein
MASPKIEVVFIYDQNGDPLPGLTIGSGGVEFASYKDDLGVNLSMPTITEIGGGAYKFTPVFPSNRGIVYVLKTGPTGNPKYVAKFMRPEDFNLDNADVPTSSVVAGGSTTLEPKIDELLQIQKGKWEIATAGPDANRLIIYEADGTTVLKKFDLLDVNGLPTAINPFKRIPV